MVPMRMQATVTRQLSLWLAIMAVLMGALAPSVSMALGGNGANNAAWAEICTSSGFQPAALSGEPAAPDSAHLFEHCPYCSLHTPTLGLPPADLGLALPAPAAELLPALFLVGPGQQHNWTVAHPRGPPVAALLF
ncbi:MAG: DUF2946 domain-containing protein [Methylibium sp.]|nr:DUF2946 domain-containing protein [Methylibium sp.]